MELRTFATNRAFLQACGGYLSKHPELTQLVTINARLDPDKELQKEMCRGMVYEQDEILLVFLNAIPYNLQLYSESFHPEAVKRVVHHLITEIIPIKGVQGNKPNTDAFINEYSSLTGIKFRNRLSMDIMRLDRLNDTDHVGNFRIANERDVDQLTSIELAFYREAIHENPNSCELKEKVRTQIDKKQLWVVTDSLDRIVSVAMASREMDGGRAISLVYTLPEERNKGYSSSLLHQLCMILFEQGYQFVSLFVDKTNPVSNRLYLKLGFRIVEDNFDYVILEV